ncbi:MAG: hypothetical protein EON88_30600, partial [Brevundimonas sp.]
WASKVFQMRLSGPIAIWNGPPGASAQASAARAVIMARLAAEAWADAPGGPFQMAMGPDSRIWNTFDAHRLIHWAGTHSPAAQKALKTALLRTHFSDNRALADHVVLADAAAAAGLDRAEAVEVLADDLYAAEVRADEALWRSRGISAVPAVVVEGKYLISGGQPAEVFEQALRKIAAEG